MYLLSAMLKNLDITLAKPKDSKHFYQLLKTLFEMTKEDSSAWTHNSAKLIAMLSLKLISYSPIEQKGSWQSDYNLSGIIDILTLLIQNHQSASPESEYEDLLR